ncbi:Phenylalanine/histidine ammonia-lyase [Leifsonia rubra CMS 76R]|nr:Phenylalanine/histidine ammonia-lyase [Leifsonia rubra CMS 76R]
MVSALLVSRAEDLGADEIVDIADGRRVELREPLIASVRARRDEVLAALSSGSPVYGVNTGMGAASDVILDEEAQQAQQNHLMLARAVGDAPWLSARETRAVMAMRLRTFLALDAGVSVELCGHLVSVLNRNLQPAIPKTGLGAAGEIIPLAHLGGSIAGSGEFVGPNGTRAAADALADAGLRPFAFGPKEGVAFIEGVPVTTALALLAASDASRLVDQAIAVVAGSVSLVGASRDSFADYLARGDDELLRVLRSIRDLAGPLDHPRNLQSPLSFRIAGPGLAQLLRTITAVHGSVARAITGVTDSPAYIDGQFVGTAGFDGFDLAASLDSLRVSVIHLAETSTARLHRLLDPRVTGLSRQLSDRPGLHAGMVTTHKRAVGVTHAMLTRSRPASLGSIETSLGQEDVQSFSVESAVACLDAIDDARVVLACELLAIVQGLRLSATMPAPDGGRLSELLTRAADALPPGTGDRPFGRDIATLTRILGDSWAYGTLS